MYYQIHQTFGMQWNAVAGATSYHLEQTEEGRLNQTTTIYSGSSTTQYVTLTQYIDDTFYYSVQACFGSQCSPWVQATIGGTELTKTGTPQAVPATASSP